MLPSKYFIFTMKVLKEIPEKTTPIITPLTIKEELIRIGIEKKEAEELIEERRRYLEKKKIIKILKGLI